MNKEIIISVNEQNNETVVSSLQVADDFGKQHKDVLKSIEAIKAQNCAVTEMFYETTYKSGTGKNYKMYLMNRDGFSLLVMGFTGKNALEWKLKYINAFNDMDKKLKTSPVSDTKRLEVEAKYSNAKARLASIWLKLADRVPANAQYQQICNAYASEALTGTKVLPLPECNERYYSATEIAKIVGSNANTVGKKAKAACIRPKDETEDSPNGKWFFDKSAHSNKEVSTFRYNDKGLELIKRLFEEM